MVVGPAHRHIEYSPRQPDLPRGDEHDKARAGSPNEPVVVEPLKRFLMSSRTYGVWYRSRVVKAWACERKARWPRKSDFQALKWPNSIVSQTSPFTTGRRVSPSPVPHNWQPLLQCVSLVKKGGRKASVQLNINASVPEVNEVVELTLNANSATCE